MKLEPSSIHDVLILGAGLSGLTAARDLHAAGRRVLLLDKSLGVGGRAATRRWDDVPVDHGAQFFTARSPEFRAQTDRWLAEDVCFEWTTGFHQWDHPHGLRPPTSDAADRHPRYACHGGMSALGKNLAQSLPKDALQLDTRVTRLRRNVDAQGRNYWQAEIEDPATDHQPAAGYSLILTFPTPQALALLEASALLETLDPSALAQLRTVEYAPTLAVLLRGFAPSTSWQGIQLRDKTLSWISADTTKREGTIPTDGAPQVFVLHSSPDFSREHQDADLEKATDLMVARASEIVGDWITTLPDRQIHRWRYANVPHGVETGASLQLTQAGDPPLYVAGDAFLGAKVEGAFFSGTAAAKAILAEDSHGRL